MLLIRLFVGRVVEEAEDMVEKVGEEPWRRKFAILV